MFTRLEEEIDLLERHIKILRIVVDKEPIGILKLSEKSNLPPHKIRYSLRILEQCGMIKPSFKGALTTNYGKEYLGELTERLIGLVQRIESLKN